MVAICHGLVCHGVGSFQSDTGGGREKGRVRTAQLRPQDDVVLEESYSGSGKAMVGFVDF